MTLAGWILLTVSWSVILGIVTFCFITMSRVGKI